MHWLESLRMCLCNMIDQLWLRRESHFIQPCLCLCNHYFLLEACAWWTDNEGHYNSAVKLHNNQLKCRKRAWNLPGSHYHCRSLNLSVLAPDLSREMCVSVCVFVSSHFSEKPSITVRCLTLMSWIFMSVYNLSAGGPSLCHLYQLVCHFSGTGLERPDL